MLESIEAAFQKSDSHLKETYKHVPLAGPGPQSHHFTVQEALLSLPKDEKFEASNQATKPAGGYYALIRAGTMQITTSVITMGRTPPIRDAKFRRDLSRENERLEKQHPDLFSASASPLGSSQDALHALLLPHTSDHSSPIGVTIAVPYSDPRAGFHLYMDVGQLWQYYSEAGDEVVDIAYPTLRDRMRRAEKRDQSEGGNE
ncbi:MULTISPECIES: hypothetical protein [unclassified Halomonas]|uniref:hypothetical protein n=1 Tax=unclassified Halomonas TaxID=2609666 RepID=UPI0007D91902|nr:MULTISPECIES: hypothetical protein [unclassified Halomonas]MBT2787598.1 hypothetical protein [Halomonas sp. ISL-106]MBT2799019.1 hypothetical protein [Halomonas sp. ISL-104]OAL61547.1 hypothetical protein A6R74_13625 [Halomonas sp. ALS9]